LQAKLARTFLRLSTLRSGNLLFVVSPGPELYIRVAKAPILGHGLFLYHLPFHPFTIAVGLLELLFGQHLI
jgi:uncharacterized membrane protein